MLKSDEFEQTATAVLTRIECALDDADLDYDKTEGVIEIDLADKGKIIVNRHNAAQEIWLAARSGGYHFAFDNGLWRSRRDGEELLAALARCLHEQTGARIDLA